MLNVHFVPSKHLSLTFLTFVFQILTLVLPMAQHTSRLRHRRALVITVRRRHNVCRVPVRAPVIFILISLANIHSFFIPDFDFTTCGQPTISREGRRALVIPVQRQYKVRTIASLCTQTPLANLPEFKFQVLTFGRLDSLFHYFEYSLFRPRKVPCLPARVGRHPTLSVSFILYTFLGLSTLPSGALIQPFI
jgi:hypothetical protein